MGELGMAGAGGGGASSGGAGSSQEGQGQGARPPANPYAGATFDVILAGASVYDGLGHPAVRADVGLRGDRIAAVGDLAQSTAPVRYDLRGLALAPGFINLHSHTWETLAEDPSAGADLLQGVTTVVGGVDGRSAIPLAPWLARWEAEVDQNGAGGVRSGGVPGGGAHGVPGGSARGARSGAGAGANGEQGEGKEEEASAGLPVNLVMLAGQGAIRQAVMGRESRTATPTEIIRMQELAAQAIRDGAWGLSTGLEYVPGRYASQEEIVQLVRATSDAAAGGPPAIYATHLRSEGDRVTEAVREAIEIAQQGGAFLDISHFKIVYARNWGKLEQVLRDIEAARSSGTPIFADVYPWLTPDYGSHLLLADVYRTQPPERIVLKEAPGHAELVGLTLAEAASRLWTKPASLASKLLKGDRKVHAAVLLISPENLRRTLQLPWTVISSDGGSRPRYADAQRRLAVHPRVYGNYPELLGRYVREEGILTLEQAVAKASGLAAASFGLRERGLLQEGAYADLVAFDPLRVASRATWAQPEEAPAGIQQVWLNGQLVVADGKLLPDVKAGRLLRRPA